MFSNGHYLSTIITYLIKEHFILLKCCHMHYKGSVCGKLSTSTERHTNMVAHIDLNQVKQESDEDDVFVFIYCACLMFAH